MQNTLNDLLSVSPYISLPTNPESVIVSIHRYATHVCLDKALHTYPTTMVKTSTNNIKL